MASKKGIIITAIILAAITGASFMIWQIPTELSMTVVVSDFESHIVGIDERFKIISNALDESFTEMINGEITPDEYISIAEISSTQINSQIIVEQNPNKGGLYPTNGINVDYYTIEIHLNNSSMLHHTKCIMSSHSLHIFFYR